MATDERLDRNFGRGLVLWTYQKRREAALGLTLAAQAERDLAHEREAYELQRMAGEHVTRAAQMHAMLWPRDPDPEALCSVPDLLEVFQVLVAALEHCDLFTDAPEKAATLQFLAPYIERASQWIGPDRITAGLAAIPKAD